jgi:hypothetical protein
VARRVTHRLRRKEIFERTPPVSVRVVFGAGVLARQVGGPQVMADQIASLCDEVRGDRVGTAVDSAYYELPDQVARYGQVFDTVYRQSVSLKEHLSAVHPERVHRLARR